MTDSAPARILLCRVGAQKFGLQLDAVKEVCTDLPVVRMPGVAVVVEGVANVRGTVVTVLSGAALIGQEGPPGPRGDWLVVLRSRNGRVALAVDEVEDFGASTGVPILDIEALLRPLFPGGR
ncbi:MAG: chemotaxis protein CheW [Gemmatimonadota bacterium]